MKGMGLPERKEKDREEGRKRVRGGSRGGEKDQSGDYFNTKTQRKNGPLGN